MPFFKFENLRLYYKALDFSDSILALASNHSDSSDAHFFNRFSDEALNVVMTIADGGAEGKNEFISQLQNTKAPSASVSCSTPWPENGCSSTPNRKTTSATNSWNSPKWLAH